MTYRQKLINEKIKTLRKPFLCNLKAEKVPESVVSGFNAAVADLQAMPEYTDEFMNKTMGAIIYNEWKAEQKNNK